MEVMLIVDYCNLKKGVLKVGFDCLEDKRIDKVGKKIVMDWR
jgi:hypothetical protein